MFVRFTLPVGVLNAAGGVSASPGHCFFGREGWLISRHAFGSRLRTQRERRGVTLESIVDSTKIKQSLLEALERGDASQWPRGLFRRAYLRNYACAIGLPAEPLVAEFVKLFPEDGSPVSDDSLAAAQEPMRLTFAIEPDTRVRRLAARPRRCRRARRSGRGRHYRVVATGWTLLDGLRRRGARLLSGRDGAHRTCACRPYTCAAS